MLNEQSSSTVNFADVAHQTLIFSKREESSRLILELIDTPWVQRLRRIAQTGNTNLVYMFSEHSRFGHSLGVAYLSHLLMTNLEKHSPDEISPYKNAVAAAALLHDIGHVAPGSHLAEKLWGSERGKHETITARIIREDNKINTILKNYGENLSDTICKILACDSTVPPWTSAIISGGGWNADRGNWAIVDSAMCAVNYGRYNVMALIDAYRLSKDKRLVIEESRLDALTHFYVARESMYRQIYQHRVLQAVDALTRNLTLRLKDILATSIDNKKDVAALQKLNIYCDDVMFKALSAKNYASDLPLCDIFSMTESWWGYHLNLWCNSKDPVLSDLATRLRDRELFKTVRINNETSTDEKDLLTKALEITKELGLDPRYYVTTVDDADTHRGKTESAPLVLLDNGDLIPVNQVEPIVEHILGSERKNRRWLAVPKEVKKRLGRLR